MGKVFYFEMPQMRVILDALRHMEDKERVKDPHGSQKAAAMVKNFKSQIYGPIAQLEVFMRGKEWLRTEIAYERQEDEQRNNKCDCGRACKGKMCASCWSLVYKTLYGESSDDYPGG